MFFLLWQTRNIAAVVIYLNAFLTVATSYKCLQCDDVPLPNLCDKVGECGAHELCAVEQYTTSSGSFRYRQKCMDMQACEAGDSNAGNNALTCKECCHGDLCNAGGCGKKGFDLALGPLCYACPIQIGPKNCYKIQQCGRDQVCSIHPVLRLGAPDTLFETKCTEQHVCATINDIGSSMIVGRKRSTCNVCCDSSLCNDFDSRPCAATNSVSTVATSPTTKTTSVHSEQTSSMQTVTAKKTVTSNGFTKASVTPEVCEDAANAFCNENICSRSPKEYIQINCRKTCQLCTKPTTRQAVTTEKTVTFNGLSTASATRGADVPVQNKRIVTIVIFLQYFLTTVTSYKCLLCDDVPLPNLCEEVGECGAHELCAVEQYVTAAGTFRFRQKCMDQLQCGTATTGLGKRNELLTCSECCQGDLCNAAGCGEKGFDPAFGPICYACSLQIGTGSCDKVQQCGRDKTCSIHPVTRLGAPDNLFETKCTELNMCVARDEIDSSSIVGRKRSTCSFCCNSTLCNDFDSRPCVPSSTTAAVNSVSSVTTSPATKTTSLHSEPTSTMQTVTSQKTVTSNKFTTAPTTPEVCEDASKFCNEHACSGSPKEYIEKNCRKTCHICGNPITTIKTTPEKTSTTTATTTASPSTVTSTPLRTSIKPTTSNSGITDHTHGLFCRDVAVGCDQFVHFCILDAYRDWTKSSCRRTCNYC